MQDSASGRRGDAALEFVKVEGLGNDFVLVEGTVPSTAQIRHWCDRRTGIGADGFLRVSRSDHPEAVARMEYWNSDGSVAGMCGNGLRCVALYVFERGWTDRRSFTIETPTGLNRVEVMDDGPIRAELGPYRIGRRSVMEGLPFTEVDIGNPHAVALVPTEADVEQAPLARVGTVLQDYPRFPDGVNVEFGAPTDRGLRVRVWERGAGATLACGTGAAAVAAVAYQEGRAGSAPDVELPGGRLGVELINGVAWISGPAVMVFSGTILR